MRPEFGVGRGGRIGGLDIGPLDFQFVQYAVSAGEVEVGIQRFVGAAGGPRAVVSLRPQAVDGQLALPQLLRVMTPPESLRVGMTEFRLVGHGVHVEIVGVGCSGG